MSFFLFWDLFFLLFISTIIVFIIFYNLNCLFYCTVVSYDKSSYFIKIDLLL